MNINRLTRVLMALLAFAILGAMVTIPAHAADPEHVIDILVRGNGKVESDAVVSMLKTRKGDVLNAATIRDDIKTLFELGYFRTVRITKVPSSGGINLIVNVEEKPAIVSIKFAGMDEIEETDVKEKLETKLYTIVNEATITNDLRMIEKQYLEKGFYLAHATYTLDKAGTENEVDLTFHIEEGGKVLVGDVFLLGNKFFTLGDVVSKMAMQPYSRSAAFSSSAQYQDDLVKRDLEMMSYYYRDNGFMDVKVAKPITLIDPDREFVRLTYQVEEGVQYYIESLDIQGDLLFPKEELIAAMKLKPGQLFRQSQFNHDMDMLTDKYGDLGYAFVDIQPKPTFNREKRTAAIVYEIAKGDKIYFGEMLVIGNTKTRDNVLRRDFEVADAELYRTTGLTNSKKNVDRLGFFEEVQVLRERVPEQPTSLNLKFKVKEKPTGQLNASIGFSPGQGTTQNNWTGQGSYTEQNQSGRGYYTQFKGTWNGDKNYSVDIDFSNPRVNDSVWSSSFALFYRNEVVKVLDDVEVQDKRYGGSVGVGRKIFELVRGNLTYKASHISQTSDKFLLDRYIENAIASSVILGVSRADLNNYIDPSEGSRFGINQQFTGGVLLGTQRYMESSAYGTYYFPVDFSETFRTYFKFNTSLSYIYPLRQSEEIPFSERYKMGGYDDMRGWKWGMLGPHVNLLRAPGGYTSDYNKGGDKKLLMQFEYFMPLIPEAGIKALVFTDWGRVYDDPEAIELKDLNRDVGFGFRWITPIAPFRFEWAYPYIDGHLGDSELIFSIGY